jgi:hypothetical protein
MRLYASWGVLPSVRCSKQTAANPLRFLILNIATFKCPIFVSIIILLSGFYSTAKPQLGQPEIIPAPAGFSSEDRFSGSRGAFSQRMYMLCGWLLIRGPRPRATKVSTDGVNQQTGPAKRMPERNTDKAYPLRQTPRIYLLPKLPVNDKVVKS